MIIQKNKLTKTNSLPSREIEISPLVDAMLQKLSKLHQAPIERVVESLVQKEAEAYGLLESRG